MGAIGSLDTELVENKYDYQNIEYQTMICFLLMLMSVSEREGSRFLYWLWFDLDDSVIVTGDNMATMLNDLVGPDIADPESKNKRHKKILKNLAKATKIVDGSNYTFKNFCVLDMQLGSPFLSRLEYVQKDLVNNFMDVNCWRKLSARVAVVNNLEALKYARRRLQERPILPPKLHTYRSTGERKRSLISMLVFAELYEDFVIHHVINAEALSDILPQRKGWADSFYMAMKEMLKKKDNDADADEDPFEKDRVRELEEEKGENDTIPTMDSTAQDTADNSSKIAADDMVSLTKRFRRELKWPLPKVYSMKAAAIRSAINQVLDAKNNVIPAEDIDLDDIAGDPHDFEDMSVDGYGRRRFEDEKEDEKEDEEGEGRDRFVFEEKEPDEEGGSDDDNDGLSDDDRTAISGLTMEQG